MDQTGFKIGQYRNSKNAMNERNEMEKEIQGGSVPRHSIVDS